MRGFTTHDYHKRRNKRPLHGLHMHESNIFAEREELNLLPSTQRYAIDIQASACVTYCRRCSFAFPSPTSCCIYVLLCYLVSAGFIRRAFRPNYRLILNVAVRAERRNCSAVRTRIGVRLVSAGIAAESDKYLSVSNTYSRYCFGLFLRVATICFLLDSMALLSGGQEKYLPVWVMNSSCWSMPIISFITSVGRMGS